MKNKIYNMILIDDYTTREYTVSSYNLPKILDDFIQKNYKEIHLVIDEEWLTKLREFENEKELKEKFHRSKRNIFYQKYKSKKINESTYRKVLTNLKRMKMNSKSLDDFKNRYEEYIKNISF